MEETKVNELESRIKGFNEKLIPILAEFKLGLGAVPVILPDGRIAARPHVFDDSKKAETVETQVENKEEVKSDIATA
jgi:hypothetical protein